MPEVLDLADSVLNLLVEMQDLSFPLNNWPDLYPFEQDLLDSIPLLMQYTCALNGRVPLPSADVSALKDPTLGQFGRVHHCGQGCGRQHGGRDPGLLGALPRGVQATFVVEQELRELVADLPDDASIPVVWQLVMDPKAAWMYGGDDPRRRLNPFKKIGNTIGGAISSVRSAIVNTVSTAGTAVVGVV